MMLIPIWVRLVILAVLCSVCFGSGFMLGVEWESNKRDAAELKRVKDVEIRIKEVEKVITKVETKYVNRYIVRQVVKEKITQEVDRHVETIPDPRECWLAPDRVSTINRAARGTEGAGGEAGAVPAAAGAAVGEPQRGGALGGGHGIQVPRVLGQIFGTGGDGASAAGANP
ncbi:MAG TPA: hypothetical protein PKV98_04265 [Burkholderiaceae bacterium]|nr:hypothetical protein [Burkholderiaceae bacterium]